MTTMDTFSPLHHGSKTNIKLFLPYPKRLIPYLWDLYLRTYLTYPEVWQDIVSYVESLNETCPENYINTLLAKLQEKIEAYRGLNKQFDLSWAGDKEIITPEASDCQEDVEEVLYSLGYRQKEIKEALNAAYNHVTDKNDIEQLLQVVLKILSS